MTIETLTELQYANKGKGPWALYIYGFNGYHSGKRWFRLGQMKYPDEEISYELAKSATQAAIDNKQEVRICDGGDMLVFHAINGEVVYGKGFWD